MKNHTMPDLPCPVCGTLCRADVVLRHKQAISDNAQSAVSPIGQSDVEMLKQLADGMGFGRTHDMLRRVIAACPYLVSSAQSGDGK